MAQWMRRLGGRGLGALLVGAMIAVASTAAMAPRAEAKQASIVIDADTGEVLHEQSADETNYPASLTKMMTLYMLFDALDSGQVKLDQMVPVSQHAATRAPSKLGLGAGDEVTVHDCMYGLVTKSANDCAAVIAEALAGSESAFAEKMTQRARKIGMKSTVFYNASGLPNSPQNRTTARDLATLARALYRDFPKHYKVFATKEFVWNGQPMANHNHLMNSYPGMDGIKTGFINASGFNLAASAVRNNRRLIGVVMGGQSARSRDIQMASLLNSGFARPSRGKLMIAKADDTEVASVAEAAEPAATEPAAAPASPAATKAAPAPRKTARAPERWTIQVGAFAKENAAEKAARVALKALPAAAGKTVEVAGPAKGDKERLYRARLTNFSKQEADHACSVLHRKHQKCTVVAPSTIRVASN